MGKWCEVKCSCPNRNPLPHSHWSDEPYLGKHKTKQQAEIRQKWKEKIYGMYECGHRDGCFLQLPPSHIFTVGYGLKEAFGRELGPFEIYRKITDPRNYEDEYLVLSLSEVDLWQMEINQIGKYILGEQYMGWNESRAWERYWKKYWSQMMEWKDRSHDPVEEDSWFMMNEHEMLKESLEICHASMVTQNPVEFFW
jgi:hypothetical protein